MIFFFNLLATAAACGIFVPWPGIELVPLHWQHGVLTTGPPGKSWTLVVFVWVFEILCPGGHSPILVPSLLTWLAVVPVIYQSQTVCLCPEGHSGSTLWQGSSPKLALLRILLSSHKFQHCMSATTWEVHLAAPDPCLPFSGVAGNRGCPLLPVLRAHIEQSSRTVAAFSNLPDSAGLHFIGAYHFSYHPMVSHLTPVRPQCFPASVSLMLCRTLTSCVQLSCLCIGLPRWLSRRSIHLQCRRCKGCGFDPWVKKMPWRRAWQPTPVFLPGESHGQRSLVGYSP